MEIDATEAQSAALDVDGAVSTKKETDSAAKEEPQKQQPIKPVYVPEQWEVEVESEDEEGEEVEYRIVGPDEFNVAEGKISMDSPLGKALLGKRVDNEIKISTPKEVKVFYISKIRYK